MLSEWHIRFLSQAQNKDMISTSLFILWQRPANWIMSSRCELSPSIEPVHSRLYTFPTELRRSLLQPSKQRYFNPQESNEAFAHVTFYSTEIQIWNRFCLPREPTSQSQDRESVSCVSSCGWIFLQSRTLRQAMRYSVTSTFDTNNSFSSYYQYSHDVLRTHKGAWRTRRWYWHFSQWQLIWFFPVLTPIHLITISDSAFEYHLRLSWNCHCQRRFGMATTSPKCSPHTFEHNSSTSLSSEVCR